MNSATSLSLSYEAVNKDANIVNIFKKVKDFVHKLFTNPNSPIEYKSDFIGLIYMKTIKRLWLEISLVIEKWLLRRQIRRIIREGRTESTLSPSLLTEESWRLLWHQIMAT